MEQEPNPLKLFQEEIRRVAEDETAAHFKHGKFNPEDLNEEDMDIWEKVKDKSVTRDDVNGYRKSVGEESESRKIFLGFINNKSMGLFLQREIEQKKKT